LHKREKGGFIDICCISQNAALFFSLLSNPFIYIYGKIYRRSLSVHTKEIILIWIFILICPFKINFNLLITRFFVTNILLTFTYTTFISLIKSHNFYWLNSFIHISLRHNSSLYRHIYKLILFILLIIILVFFKLR
jgi:hypothetical protein